MRKSAVSALFKSLRACSFLMLGGFLALGCTKSAPAEQSSGTFEVGANEQFLFTGTSKPDTLSKEEWATYQADRLYISRMAPEFTPVVLNHADERQHRFVLLRLRMAGKTPQNSPQLFKLVASKRTEHQAKGYMPGSFVEIQVGNGRGNKHYFGSLNILPNDRMEVLATGSVMDELFYGYVDSAVWDMSGTALGDMAYTEIYGNLLYNHARTTGDLTRTQQQNYQGDSLLIEDTVNYGYRETYLVGRNGRGPVKFADPVVTAPINMVGDPAAACPVSVCLNRTWTHDCDYDLTGTQTALKLPLQGSISISSQAGVYDLAKIDAYKQGSATDSTGQPDPGGAIRVVLTNVGGGCDVDGNNAIALGMRAFWANVTISPDLKTLSWDMTGANAALFDSSCRQVQDKVELSMNIKLPYLDGQGNTGIFNQFMTNNPNADMKSKLIPCITVTNSCLAAGTLISMSDGSLQPIESIQGGDTVSNPHDTSDLALVVADTAKGVELEPMVRIQEERGRSLLMTKMHPMPVLGRGMVLAKNLKVGDKVMTSTGPSKLTKVSAEPYEGMVYNLKVGSAEELASLGEDQTVVYANGFLVGDGQIQTKYETQEQMMLASKPARLPIRWKKDFTYSASR
jgi:hypothetical protein